jgi:N-succinyl-L-ornithine transcarbamylase
MQHFTSVHDVGNFEELLRTALKMKKKPHVFRKFGKRRTLGCIFFNPSLRTRMSTQRAAFNLGMDVIILNVGSDGWKLEFVNGAVMNAGNAEHIKDAAAVMGLYCDILAIRAFAKLQNRDEDYREEVLEAFKEYSDAPVISLESATLHPCQSLADIVTIEQYKQTEKPKVLLTWAPHPRALPQAVANSFAEWCIRAGYRLRVSHPPGYALDERFVPNEFVDTDPEAAWEDADFVYAKNWSSYEDYGKVLNTDPAWMVTAEKMQQTNDAFFMHCLPVRRNVVVADEVIDGKKSLVLEQAANRIVAAQAVLKTMLEVLKEQT